MDYSGAIGQYVIEAGLRSGPLRKGRTPGVLVERIMPILESGQTVELRILSGSMLPVLPLDALVTIAPIDGPGQILGGASPCWVRLPSYLTLVGDMTFDVADMAMLAEGYGGRPAPVALAQLLRPLQKLPFDHECAEHAARIRASLEASGTPLTGMKCCSRL